MCIRDRCRDLPGRLDTRVCEPRDLQPHAEVGFSRMAAAGRSEAESAPPDDRNTRADYQCVAGATRQLPNLC